MYINIQCHTIKSNGLKIALGESRWIKRHKTNTQLTTIRTYSNRECFNVTMPTWWSYLFTCVQFKAPLVPRANDVGNAWFIITAAREFFYVTKVQWTTLIIMHTVNEILA